MPAQVSERLTAARGRWFVGREAERDLFRAALKAPDLPFSVLVVYGPGGIGKSTLLAAFARLAQEAGAAAHTVDARTVEPSPEALIAAVRSAIGLLGEEHPLDALARRSGRHVLLIDTVEALAPLDTWLRDTFLPRASENTLVVLAGRHPPGAAWRSDPGWRSMLHALPLRNLSPAESRSFLARQDVPADQHASVLDFTHGHPLALSLVADLLTQRGDAPFRPQAEPDVIKALLDRFVGQLPGPAERLALEACAVARATTEPLLARVLEQPEAREIFEWLRGLSFVESGPGGLYPHDLAREALLADLRWRNPERYTLLHDRIRDHYLSRLTAAADDQQRILADYVFLHRDNPVVRPFLEWQEHGSLFADGVRDADPPLLLTMVRQYEGPQSAGLAAHWIERQPEGVTVFRDGEHQPAGFMASVALERATAEEIAFDPAALATARFLGRQAPPRPGERVTLFRFWMARDTYQAVSSVQSLTFINAVRQYLTTPDLASTFFACAEPDFWAPVFAYADLYRVPEADFAVDGRRYGVYWHDWRVVPPLAWLQLLARREIATAQAAPPPAPAPPMLVLSEPDFAAAVREALRDFHRPEALRRNPLLRSRLVAGRPDADAGGGVAALRSLIEAAIAALRHAPRDAKLHRALDRTFIRPAATQEQAADLLDLPFSTYRRHLVAGIARVSATLWRLELRGDQD